MPIDPAVLDELERLEKAATVGPWEASDWRICHHVNTGRIGVICDTANNKKTRTEENQANAALIAAMRNELPSLIAALRESQANDRRYRKVCEHRHVAFRGFGFQVWVVEMPDIPVLMDGEYSAEDFDAAIDKLDAATEAEHG